MATDLEATHRPHQVTMADFRRSVKPPSLQNDGFELLRVDAEASLCFNFDDPASVTSFYGAMESAVRVATGADRVHVFDHTLRVSGVDNLNSLDGKSAAGAVIRVHGDYTMASGPVRLQALVDDGVLQLPRGWPGRFAFVNVWRSIDTSNPVLSHPLALCRPSSVDYVSHTWPYFMHFESRVGQNLAVESVGAAAHEWGYYPRMTSSEAIFFVTFDSSCTGHDVGVIHTSFDDPAIAPEVPRRSVELRTVAVWDN